MERAQDQAKMEHIENLHYGLEVDDSIITSGSCQRKHGMSLRPRRSRQQEHVEKTEKRIDLVKMKNDVSDEDTSFDDSTILRYCEVKIEDIKNEKLIINEDEEVVHFNDETDDEDVYGDFMCHKCNIQFTTWNRLKRHTKLIHEAIQGFKCKICFKVFSKLMAFDTHVIAEHGTGAEPTEDFLDKLTLYRVSRGTSLHTRTQRANNAVKPTMSDVDSQTKFLSCCHCKYKVRNKHRLAQHVVRHIDDDKLCCKVCKKKCETRRKLALHVRDDHREERKPRRKPKKDCVCHTCGKILSRADRLQSHLRIHTGEKPYACIICKESFGKKNSLKQHLLLHTGTKPYVCDICGRAFTQKPGLTGHRKSHPGPLPPLPPIFIGPLIDEMLKQYEQ